MKNILFVTLIFFIVACDKDSELKKSTFVPDADSPTLPRYSEWGYNTFGAFYDRQSFVSNDKEVPIKVVSKEGNTLLVFTGIKRDTNYGGSFFSMTLVIGGFDPSICNDLIALDNTIMDLTDPKYSITFADPGNMDIQAEVISGTFKIIRAQNLRVDNQFEEVILSGVFDLQVLVDDLPVTISSGRFDVGVGSDNFFKF